MATVRYIAQILRPGLLGVALLSAAAGAQPSGEALERAKALLEAHKPQQAYELLTQMEFDGAGDIEFDYTLGVAALDAGKPDKATLAFDRVLAVNPNHAGALVDRGRAHAALGNKQEARADFEAALALDPPTALRARLQSFLTQLERPQQTRGLRFSSYAALTLGHDSNVNFATNEPNVFVPALNVATILDPDSTRQSDAFATFSGGAALSYAVDERYGWSAGVDAYSKRNHDEHEFTLSGLELRAGPYVGSEKQQLRLLVNAGTAELADNPYRKHYGGGGEWRYALAGDKQLLASVQHLRLRYREADTKTFDTNQSVALLGLLLNISRDIPRSVTPYLWVGREDVPIDNLDGDKQSRGAGMLGRWGLSPTRAVLWSVSAQRGAYQRENSIFLERRKDRRYDASLAFSQQFRKVWSLRPQVTWTKQVSNIDPYDFERVEASLSLRRDFE